MTNERAKGCLPTAITRGELVARDLSGADLRGANFDAAILVGCTFAGADLRGATFVACELRDVVFTGAVLGDNRFDGTTLIDPIGLSVAQQRSMSDAGATFQPRGASLR